MARSCVFLNYSHVRPTASEDLSIKREIKVMRSWDAMYVSKMSSFRVYLYKSISFILQFSVLQLKVQIVFSLLLIICIVIRKEKSIMARFLLKVSNFVAPMLLAICSWWEVYHNSRNCSWKQPCNICNIPSGCFEIHWEFVASSLLLLETQKDILWPMVLDNYHQFVSTTLTSLKYALII
jgi:hypothetical protein